MQLQPSKSRNLEFPIGDVTYVVPPVGVAVGIKLAELLTADDAARAKLKIQTVDLFKMAVGTVWEQMADDGVPYTEAFRVGMTCLAREQALLYESGPDRWDKADEVAAAVWESGIDPEELAAYMAARTGTATNRATRRAGASSTRKLASGNGTSARKNPAKSGGARRSPGHSSGARGR